MTNQGFSLNDSNNMSFDILLRKYAKDYKMFFDALNKAYSKNTSVKKEITTALSKIQEIVTLLGGFKSGRAKIDSKLLKKSFQLMSDVDQTVLSLIAMSSTNASLKKKLESVEQAIGVDVNELQSVEQSIGMLSDIKKSQPSLTSRAAKTVMGLSPTANEMGGELLTTVRDQLLGPLAPIATMGWEGLTGGYKALRDWNRNRKRNKLGASLLQKSYDTPDSMFEARAGLRGSGTALGGAGNGIQDVDEQTLYSFYNTKAMKAQWTKRLLAAVEGRKVEGGSITGTGEPKGFWGNLLDGIKQPFVDVLSKLPWGAMLKLGLAGVALTILAGDVYLFYKALQNWKAVENSLAETYGNAAYLDELRAKRAKTPEERQIWEGKRQQHLNEAQEAKKNATWSGMWRNARKENEMSSGTFWGEISRSVFNMVDAIPRAAVGTYTTLKDANETMKDFSDFWSRSQNHTKSGSSYKETIDSAKETNTHLKNIVSALSNPVQTKPVAQIDYQLMFLGQGMIGLENN